VRITNLGALPVRVQELGLMSKRNHEYTLQPAEMPRIVITYDDGRPDEDVLHKIEKSALPDHVPALDSRIAIIDIEPIPPSEVDFEKPLVAWARLGSDTRAVKAAPRRIDIASLTERVEEIFAAVEVAIAQTAWEDEVVRYLVVTCDGDGAGSVYANPVRRSQGKPDGDRPDELPVRPADGRFDLSSIRRAVSKAWVARSPGRRPDDRRPDKTANRPRG
jgi:hypothetical protein